MLVDITPARGPDRKDQIDQRVDGQQVDRAEGPDQAQIIDQETAERHRPEQDDPSIAGKAVQLRSLL